MTAWRLLLDEAASGARNMAVDHALLESAQHDRRPTLRLYRWRPSCISFGRNQTTRAVFDAGLAAALGIDIVRRPTGGLAVHHARELTYAVAAPVAVVGLPRAAYQRIHRALVAGLRRLGVDASIAAPLAAVGAVRPGWDPLGRDPCFRAAAPGEVLLGGRKLIGSAQRCERRTVLQHGSLLLEDDQDAVRAVQREPGPAVEAPATLAMAMPRPPSFEQLADALAAGFGDALGISLAPAPLTVRELDRAAELERLYGSDDWTWRR